MTTAVSVIVCPCWSSRLNKRRLGSIWAAVSSDVRKRWAPGRGPPVKRECELQLASDVRKDVLDLRAQDEQGCDHDDGDEGKQNAVFGHRLPLLAAELDPCRLVPIAEFHAVAPPFGGVERNTFGGVAVEAGCGHV